MSQNYPRSRKEAIQQNSKYYFTGEPCKRGHLSIRTTKNSYCKECSNLHSKKYRLENPLYSKEYSKKYYENNKEKLIQKQSEYSKKNPDKVRLYKRKYTENNREQINEKHKLHNKQMRKNPIWRLSKNISRGIWGSLKNQKGNKHWETLVKFSIEELKEHLEKQFKEGMTWENYGNFWHVDHIKPSSLCSSFEETWSLCNLQPLERIENIRKGNRYIGSPDNKIEV